MLFAQCLPSALSKVATRSLLCYERLLSTRVPNVARVYLERALVGGRRSRPTFGRLEFVFFFTSAIFHFYAIVEWTHVW